MFRRDLRGLRVLAPKYIPAGGFLARCKRRPVADITFPLLRQACQTRRKSNVSHRALFLVSLGDFCSWSFYSS